MDDLFDHPRVDDPDDYGSADTLSFHEVVCDMARQYGRHPERYLGLPQQAKDVLARINFEVAEMVALVNGARR